MSRSPSRREFLTVAGGTALGAAALACRPATPAREAPVADGARAAPAFPPGFLWGLATSAYQIEGAADADGKGRSIWDTFTHTPGTIRNGDTGDVANDHYRRYREDVALMQSLGANAYRFSIAWPRVFPEGTGAPNPKGLDFYERLVDALLAAGIQPFATLYHWDLPQALQDRVGGWQSRETAEAFARYAGHVASRLGDRVRHFFTINEFQSFVEIGHRGKELVVGGQRRLVQLAPGLRLDDAGLNQVRHHAVLAHGLAVQAIRAAGRPGTQVGPAEVMYAAVPVIDAPEHVRAAEAATRDLNAQYLGVMLEGRYSDAYLAAAGPNAPRFTDADLRAIGSPIDFVGTNVYTPQRYVVAADDGAPYREIPFNASHPRMDSVWHRLGPEVLYWAPRLLHAIWKPTAIYVTENGCATRDVVAADGRVYDSDRVMYLRNGMAQLQRATAEGVPVRGNFVWSAMDNFEWNSGFGTRFGLVYVDFATQRRIPKLSAEWFREAARRNAVV